MYLYGGQGFMTLEVKEFQVIRGLSVFITEYNGFIEIFNNDSIRLCDKKIVIDEKKISNIHERFMHAVSCDEIKLKDKDYPPCNNELSSEICVTRCNLDNANFSFRNINRVECLYRLSRIHWVKELINMANEDDEKIKLWRYEKKDSTNGKFQWKWYLRYKEKANDFLVVFREDRDKNGEVVLNFRTAYPVYLPGDKQKLNKEYNRAKKDGNIIKNKKPAFV